jgi:CheY-like chemotaxis protein
VLRPKPSRMRGFAGVAAPDHHKALEVLEGNDPVDLLVTDLLFPNGIHGFALARMRRLGLKVIYVTGFDVPEAEAVRQGVAQAGIQRAISY